MGVGGECTQARPGTLGRDNNRRKVEVYFVGRDSRDVDVPVAEPYFSAELSEPIGLSTGKMRDLAEIRAVIDQGERDI